jgi:signal transduction histidine kinase
MGETEIIVFIALVSFAIIAFVVMTIALLLQYRKKKIAYENEKKESEELHKTELLNVKLEVQEETMQHIGIEIHDSIAEKLTLASLHLQHAEYENKYPGLNDILILGSTLINESLDELRLLSRRLLKQADEQTDIVQSLQRECNRVALLKICAIHFATDCPAMSMDTKVANTLLRIVQESIQNSLKHANCKNITVSIANKQRPFTLCISDDGIGFDMEAANLSQGIGLKSIKKRVGIIGAELVQTSSPENGTTTKVVFPQQNGLF